jgi:hypothetical protein
VLSFWLAVVAEERPRAFAGTGVDAVIGARRRTEASDVATRNSAADVVIGAGCSRIIAFGWTSMGNGACRNRA